MNRKTYPQPTTIHQAAQNALDGYNYTSSVKELIDYVIRMVRSSPGTKPFIIPIPSSIFAEEPPYIDNDIQRVYLAGLAEYMAQISAQKCPDWVYEDKYSLDEPFFMGGANSRDILLRETPSAFRNRLLFSGRALTKLFSAVEADVNRRDSGH